MSDQTRVTLQDIANSLNAPLDQVTKVILGQPGVTDDFRVRVVAALEEAGSVRLSRETKTGTLGVVVPGTLIGDYIGEVVRGVTETAKQRGYSVVLYRESNAKEVELIRMLEPGGCSGMIAVVPNHYERLLELCHQYQRPYVLVDYQGDDDPADALSVEVNNAQSIQAMMSYLFDLGHRRIGFITGRMQHASARQRLQGYTNALEIAGIAYDAALVREGKWFHEDGYEQAQALLGLDVPPTAIVASNDLMAFGAMQAAREQGLSIASDISITGFDDIDMASTVTPTLTTIRQPMARLGEAAVNVLIQRLSNQNAPSHTQLDTELIVRESTGPVSVS